MNKNRKELDFLAIPQEMSSLDPVTYQYFDKLLNKRTIIFNEGVDTDIVEMLILPLLDFEKDDSEEPVTLYISTPGGGVYSGLAVCNIIDNYKKKLNIIVPNFAMSMGFYLTIAGHNNPNVTCYAYPYSFFLLHAGEVGASGEAGSVRDTIYFTNKIDEMIKEYVISHTSITKEEYLEHDRKQWYLTAEEAKKYGVIDKIIGVDTDGN